MTQQCLECDPAFQARQERAKAVMDPLPKGNVPVRVAPDIQHLRSHELRLIAISGTYSAHNCLTRWNRHATHRDIHSRTTRLRVVDWCVVAQKFFDRRTQQL